MKIIWPIIVLAIAAIFAVSSNTYEPTSIEQVERRFRFAWLCSIAIVICLIAWAAATFFNL